MAKKRSTKEADEEDRIVGLTVEEHLGSVELEVTSLIQDRTAADPRLYEAILLLNAQLEKITQRLEPVIRKSFEEAAEISNLLAPLAFTCFSTGIGVRFTWEQVTYASQYEVRQGTVWETSSFRFRTTGLQGNIDPLLYGDYIFLIKTLDSQGNYSPDTNTTSIAVPVIGAPQVTTQVIDNNILLSWTEPISLFRIDYYLVQRTGATNIASGKVRGTFTSVFETVGGVYKYTVQAVDVAGNVGSLAEVEATVNQPPDFAIQEQRVSNLMGPRFQVIRLPYRPSLLCCWAPQTWHEHFRVLRNWMNIQQQMAAGYPIYIQPTALTGTYQETFDFGTVINSTIASVVWNTIVYTPAYDMNIVVDMRVSIDGTTWTPYTQGASQFFNSLRWLDLKLSFTAENDKTFIELYNLTLSLNVKRENDGGEAFANAADAGGTVVYFTKPFKDIESITCTTKSTTEPYIVIFDFQDVPNPTHFSVFVFDTMGARVSKLIDWKVRGII